MLSYKSKPFEAGQLSALPCTLLLMKIADRIRAGRLQAGWSQRDLATKMGVSGSAVAQWETAQTHPSIANRADLARLLKIPFIELVPEATGTGQAPIKDPLVFAIVQQVQKLPPPVQEGLLVQIASMVEALASPNKSSKS